MFCPKCGSQNKDAARFCGTCGASLNNQGHEQSVQPAQAVEPVQTVQPVQPNAPKKSMSKIAKIVLVEAIAVVVLLFGVSKIVGGKYTPETVATEYVEAMLAQDWSDVYEYSDFPKSEYLTKQMFVNAHDMGSEKITYRSMTARDVTERGATYKTYLIDYVEGDTLYESSQYVNLVKSGSKKYFFWDEWKVKASDLYVEDIIFEIPEGAVLKLNGKEIDVKGQDSGEGTVYVTIPYWFTGYCQVEVSAEGMETYYDSVYIATGDTGLQAGYELRATDETVREVAEKIEGDIETIISAALAGKEFSEVEHLFTSGALENQYVQEEYADLVERVYDDGESGIKSLRLGSITVEVDWISDMTIRYMVKIEKEEDYYYKYSYSDDIYEYERDGLISNSVYYGYEDGEWKLSTMPIDEYDF